MELIFLGSSHHQDFNSLYYTVLSPCYLHGKISEEIQGKWWIEQEVLGFPQMGCWKLEVASSCIWRFHFLVSNKILNCVVNSINLHNMDIYRDDRIEQIKASSEVERKTFEIHYQTICKNAYAHVWSWLDQVQEKEWCQLGVLPRTKLEAIIRRSRHLGL